MIQQNEPPRSIREYLIALSEGRADVPASVKAFGLFLTPWVFSFALRCLESWVRSIPTWGALIAAVVGYVGVMLIIACLVYWRAVWRDFRAFVKNEL